MARNPEFTKQRRPCEVRMSASLHDAELRDKIGEVEGRPALDRGQGGGSSFELQLESSEAARRGGHRDAVAKAEENIGVGQDLLGGDAEKLGEVA